MFAGIGEKLIMQSLPFLGLLSRDFMTALAIQQSYFVHELEVETYFWFAADVDIFLGI